MSTFRNLTSTPNNSELLKVQEFANENERRCQDREPNQMPLRTARILAAEVNRAIVTDHPWTYLQLRGVVKEIMQT